MCSIICKTHQKQKQLPGLNKDTSSNKNKAILAMWWIDHQVIKSCEIWDWKMKILEKESGGGGLLVRLSISLGCK